MRLAQRTMPLGEDILLARHGDRIIEMTQDRKQGLTVARLADGSTDHASNFLVNLNAMVALSPAERVGKLAGDYSADRLPIRRQDVKFMLWLSAAWATASAVVVGGMTWAIYNFSDPEIVISMMGAAF